ncbi:hypothetical protein KR222_002838 [Zaprionus bogoriensis]|nr:hypothetical protein KR222_002838 [Zaprionus bogoriensis]
MDTEDAAAIHVEAIEVLLNHLLYIRGVYPAQIFKKRRVYNTPVFMAAFPALNCYLGNVLKAVLHLLQEQQQLQLEAVIYADEGEQHLESYMLEVQPIEAQLQPRGQDQYLLEYEEQLRAALYRLAERVKKLPKLPPGARFKVHIHTTQARFTQFSQEAQYQEFPWLQADATAAGAHKLSLLPLASVGKLGLRMQAHLSISL